MSHVRQQLRKQAVAEIQAGLPTFLDSTYSTRLYNFRGSQLPACNVFADSEEEEVQTISTRGERVLFRNLTLNIEIYAIAAEDIDDVLDQYAADIEGVLGKSTLNKLASDVSITSTAFNFDSDGEQPVGILTLTWRVLYQTTEGNAETAL